MPTREDYRTSNRRARAEERALINHLLNEHRELMRRTFARPVPFTRHEILILADLVVSVAKYSEREDLALLLKKLEEANS